MAKNDSHPSGLVWKGADYTRVPEGRYQAVAIRSQGPEWIRRFARWSMLVEFELLDDGSRVCGFYNFGNDRAGWKIARGGNYFKAWTLANGELPCKGQAMSPEIFMEGQVFTVEVKDSRRNADETEKADPEMYSKVVGIISVDSKPNLESGISQSEIKNQKSTNQAINQSGLASSEKLTSFASAGRR
jgi:hypothetical protein